MVFVMTPMDLPDHEHDVERAVGVLGEEAWYCQTCDAYTFNGQVIRPAKKGT